MEYLKQYGFSTIKGSMEHLRPSEIAIRHQLNSLIIWLAGAGTTPPG